MRSEATWSCCYAAYWFRLHVSRILILSSVARRLVSTRLLNWRRFSSPPLPRIVCCQRMRMCQLMPICFRRWPPLHNRHQPRRSIQSPCASSRYESIFRILRAECLPLSSYHQYTFDFCKCLLHSQQFSLNCFTLPLVISTQLPLFSPSSSDLSWSETSSHFHSAMSIVNGLLLWLKVIGGNIRSARWHWSQRSLALPWVCQ